ncbi:hypothetical protein RQP46_003390 [Phenoliferia psychrophenolica]
MRSFLAVAALCTLVRGVADFSEDYDAVTIYFKRSNQVGAFLGSDSSGMILQKVTFDDPNYGTSSGYIIQGPSSETQKCLAAHYDKLAKRDSSASFGGDRDQFAVLSASVNPTNPPLYSKVCVGNDGNGHIDDATNKEVWEINEEDCAGSTSSNSDIKENAVKTTTDDSSSTSSCGKPAWWVRRHPGYVTDLGHTECKSALDSSSRSRKMMRRSRAERHSGLAAAKRSSTCYTIHPLNHLKDMSTLGLTGSSTTGYGGAGAVNIAVADDTSANQQWTITAL